MADLPYDMTHLPWDRQVDFKELDMYLRQVDAVQQAQNFVVIFWHKPRDVNIVYDVFKSRHLQHIQNIYWYKENQYATTAGGQYVSAVEMATIGFYPSATRVANNLPPHPREKHNHIVCPSVTKFALKEDKTPINPCQKPTMLAKKFVENHCPPGGFVCVIGTGAGGEVLGANEANCNVVGVEYDDVQFKALGRHIVKLDESARKAEEKAKQLKAKSQSTPSTTASPSTPGSQTVSMGTPTSNTEVKSGTICPECEGTIDISGDGDYHSCPQCNTGKLLHPNCSTEY